MTTESAAALVPEQMKEYVTVMAGSQPVNCGAFIGYVNGENLVIVAYPEAGAVPVNAWDEAGFRARYPEFEERVEEAVRQGMTHKEVRVCNLLSPLEWGRAPEGAKVLRNDYWGLDVPVRVKSKLGSLLRRAGRELTVTEEIWGPEHEGLTRTYHERPWVDPGTRYIWKHVGQYTGAVPGAVVFAARDSEQVLQAVAVGDFSGYVTAFYMFAFRRPGAVPGAADLLLWHICEEAARRGHSLLNLGLGVNEPIAYFKKKWGAQNFLPYVQTQWRLSPPRHPKWWGRLLNLGG